MDLVTNQEANPTDQKAERHCSGINQELTYQPKLKENHVIVSCGTNMCFDDILLHEDMGCLVGFFSSNGLSVYSAVS